MKRRGITTAWILLSSVTGIASWVLLFAVYVFIWGPIVTGLGTAAIEGYSASEPGIIPFIADIFSLSNAGFVILGVGVFVFMLILGFIFEPTTTFIGDTAE